MTEVQPTPAQERWIVAEERWGFEMGGDTGGWRRAALLPRAAFFFLGFLCVIALLGFTWIITRSPAVAGLVTGLLCLGAAEFLILNRRLFGYGFEEALHVGGLTAVAFCTTANLQHAQTFAIVYALAWALGGLRLRNPLVMVCAAGAFFSWVGIVSSWDRVALICLVFVPVLWASLALPFQRPSTQRIVEWLAVFVPAAGYVTAKRFRFDPWSFDGFDLVTSGPGGTGLLLLLLIAGGCALWLALRLRQRALLPAAAICFAATAFEVRAVVPLSNELQWIIYGGVLLGGSMLAERRLRRQRGVTSLAGKGDDDVWRLAGIALAASLGGPGRESRQSSAPAEGGGRFGGAGASGDF